MGALPIVILASLSVAFVVAAVAIWLILRNRPASPGSPGSPGSPVSPAGTGSSPGAFSSPGGTGWKKATATFYHSYPKCCPDSPTYDKNADKSECDDYSGCKYMGMFSAFDDRKPLSWVKGNNITAFFEVGQTEDSWKRKWKNKVLRVRNPKTNKALDVLVVDRCGDGDCGGCCTKNAKKNGGSLVDLEWNTAQRFWGSSNFDGEAAVEWKCLNC